MPVFRSGDPAPAWGQMSHFDIVRLDPGQEYTFQRRGEKEKLIVGEGDCQVSWGGEQRACTKGSNLDLEEGSVFRVDGVQSPTILVRMCGTWGGEMGGSGLFSGQNSPQPQDKGDRFDYVKTTNFDRHFHDCDEYWIVFAGEGTAYSEAKPYQIGPGDCLATGMGHHHDLTQIVQPIHAVFFETGLEGEKRRGHLWEHTHGKAVPHPDRI
jgi:mannose-6-phosphate isomerase-like protein (cupin superfamily)